MVDLERTMMNLFELKPKLTTKQIEMVKKLEAEVKKLKENIKQVLDTTPTLYYKCLQIGGEYTEGDKTFEVSSPFPVVFQVTHDDKLDKDYVIKVKSMKGYSWFVYYTDIVDIEPITQKEYLAFGKRSK